MRIALAVAATLMLAVLTLTVPGALPAIAAVGVATWAAYGAERTA